MVRIHNTETDEIINREMTNDEFAEYEKAQAVILAPKIEPTVAEKLESVGLSIPDLKAALGL